MQWQEFCVVSQEIDPYKNLHGLLGACSGELRGQSATTEKFLDRRHDRGGKPSEQPAATVSEPKTMPS
jgi:hypothetical protein